MVRLEIGARRAIVTVRATQTLNVSMEAICEGQRTRARSTPGTRSQTQRVFRALPRRWAGTWLVPQFSDSRNDVREITQTQHSLRALDEIQKALSGMAEQMQQGDNIGKSHSKGEH